MLPEAQDDSAPLVAHLERGREVEVHLGVTHHGSVQEKRLLVSRLAVLHVYLAGHGLHAVDDGGGSFGYLDALEPLTRDICQPERAKLSARLQHAILCSPADEMTSVRMGAPFLI